MPMANAMSDLLNKIERRLGTKPLALPPDINKDTWPDVIYQDSIMTFSRYFPHKMIYYLTPENRKGDYYIIDEGICNSVKIYGAGDIDWTEYSKETPAYQYGGGFGSFDMFASSYDAEDIMMTQMMADHVSLFANGIYVQYVPPNRVRLSAIIQSNAIEFSQHIPICLYVSHAKNLMTIEPTKMETFEKLAISDVAVYLFQYLKYYDGIDTVYASTDLKLSSLEEQANKREEIVQYLADSYVSPANKNQPIMYLIN